MIYALIGLLLLLILILIALRVGGKKEKPEEVVSEPLINTSGIYSIVRRNPRESIHLWKPSSADIRQYLHTQNVNKESLSEIDIEQLVSSWEYNLQNNIAEIEKGDKDGVEFYYYDFSSNDPVCAKVLSKGHFVTREEIFDHPKIIPPFHIGCSVVLKCHYGQENLHETARLGMRPFFSNKTMPDLPGWKEIVRVS